MAFHCEQCDSPLPTLAPGFVLATCRQCGATFHVGAQGQLRRVSDATRPGLEGASRRADTLPVREQRSLHAVPQAFVVEERGDTLRIGWNNPSFEWLLITALAAAGVLIHVPLHPELWQDPNPLLLGMLALAGLVLLYPALGGILNTTWLELGGGRLSVSTRPFPMPSAAPVDVSTLRSVFVHTYEQRRHRGWVTYTRHTVNVRVHGGGSLRIASNLASEDDARWLADILAKRLHLARED